MPASPNASPLPSLPVLDNLTIASPCTADWGQMTGDDRVRHCSHCQLNVYNLSEMSRPEAEKLVREREGNLCVRFYRRPDGTVLTADCPVGLANLRRTVRRAAVAALTLAGSLLAGVLAFAGWERDFFGNSRSGNGFLSRWLRGTKPVPMMPVVMGGCPAPPITGKVAMPGGKVFTVPIGAIEADDSALPMDVAE
jgi:hypothetical protein